MNVLVTSRNTKYSGWLVCNTLMDAMSITGKIDILVFNRSDEHSETQLKYLKSICDGNKGCQVLYLCDKDSADKAIEMFVVGGLKGRYIDDEFYLEDVSDLNELVAELPSEGGSTELSSSRVLDEFFNRYLESGETGISKGYLQVVKGAATEMVTAYQNKSLEIIKMSESASEIFSNSIDLVANMKERQRRLEKDIMSLRDKKAEVDSVTTRAVMGSPILYYPRVSYLKSKRIIRFKELGSVPYLVSFLLGFRLYLDRVKVLRPKLIVVENQGELIQAKYKDFTWVTSKSKSNGSLYSDAVVFTNCPTTQVLAKMLDDIDYDIFVVLDRTNNYKDHILNCKGMDYVVSISNCLVNEYKISKAKCVTVDNTVKGVSMSIPVFKNYPERDDQRVNSYLTGCEALYELFCMDK